MNSYLQIEALGLTNEQVEQYSDRRGWLCHSKEDYLANADGLLLAKEQQLCDSCGHTTKFGSDKFVNRIPTDFAYECEDCYLENSEEEVSL